MGEALLVDCIYFTEKMFEDDELFSPLEHLILKEQDIASKHLRAPV